MLIKVVKITPKKKIRYYQGKHRIEEFWYEISYNYKNKEYSGWICGIEDVDFGD